LPDIELSVSATTRPPRPGETDGVEYNFISQQDFDSLVAEGGFLEWARVYGNCYGTLLARSLAILNSGRDLILEIDVQGREQVLAKLPQAVSVFIVPPSLAALEQRLRGRGSEQEADIQRRLQIARQELKLAGDYDEVITNDDLDIASAQLRSIIERRRLEQVLENGQCL